jgi:hypothetical protein
VEWWEDCELLIRLNMTWYAMVFWIFYLFFAFIRLFLISILRFICSSATATFGDGLY